MRFFLSLMYTELCQKMIKKKKLKKLFKNWLLFFYKLMWTLRFINKSLIILTLYKNGKQQISVLMHRKFKQLFYTVLVLAFYSLNHFVLDLEQSLLINIKNQLNLKAYKFQCNLYLKNKVRFKISLNNDQFYV